MYGTKGNRVLLRKCQQALYSFPTLDNSTGSLGVSLLLPLIIRSSPDQLMSLQVLSDQINSRQAKSFDPPAALSTPQTLPRASWVMLRSYTSCSLTSACAAPCRSSSRGSLTLNPPAPIAEPRIASMTSVVVEGRRSFIVCFTSYISICLYVLFVLRCTLDRSSLETHLNRIQLV